MLLELKNFTLSIYRAILSQKLEGKIYFLRRELHSDILLKCCYFNKSSFKYAMLMLSWLNIDFKIITPPPPPPKKK